MNGKYYLIKKIGTKYKFYWAPFLRILKMILKIGVSR